MSKHTYKFNTDSLNFVKETVPLKRVLWRGFGFFLLSIFISTAYFFIYSLFFDTPAERIIKREQQEMLMNFELLNKKSEIIEKTLSDIQLRDDNIYRTVFEADPIPQSIRQAGIGGVDRYVHLEELPNAEFLKGTAKKLDKLAKQLYVQSISFDEVIELALTKEEMAASIPAIQPLSNKDLTRVASLFGMRMHPIYRYARMHNGIDFTAPTGTEIYATGNGVISRTSTTSRGYGKLIVVDHGFSFQTYYAHLSKILVTPGQEVKRGEVIGLVGNTGTSVAPHLHYEVRKNNQPIDPINFYVNNLTDEEYSKILELAHQDGLSLD